MTTILLNQRKERVASYLTRRNNEDVDLFAK